MDDAASPTFSSQTPDPGQPKYFYPLIEIENGILNFGGWLSWLGQGFDPNFALAGLRWMAENNFPMPSELGELRDALVAFGWRPTEIDDLTKKFEKQGCYARRWIRMHEHVVYRIAEPGGDPPDLPRDTPDQQRTWKEVLTMMYEAAVAYPAREEPGGDATVLGESADSPLTVWLETDTGDRALAEIDGLLGGLVERAEIDKVRDIVRRLIAGTYE